MSKTTTTQIEKERYLLFKCAKCDKSFKNSANDWTLAWKCPDHNDAGNEIYKIGYDDDITSSPPAQTTTKVILPEKTKAVDMTSTTISQSAGPVQLTEQQRNHAQEMKKLTEPKHTDHTNVSKWITIKDGDTRTLFFDPDRYKEVPSEYQGKVTPKVQFTVIDENSQEKFIELSFKWANRIIKFIYPDELPDGTQPESHLLLELIRQGSGKDTSYVIRPKYA